MTDSSLNDSRMWEPGDWESHSLCVALDQPTRKQVTGWFPLPNSAEWQLPARQYVWVTVLFGTVVRSKDYTVPFTAGLWIGEEPLFDYQALLLVISPFWGEKFFAQILWLVTISGSEGSIFLRQQITQPNLTGDTEGQLVQKKHV